MSTREQPRTPGQNSSPDDSPSQVRPAQPDPAGRSRAPLVLVGIATGVFAVLLALIVAKWAPLESADRSAADHINNLVSGHPALVSVVKVVTMAGNTLVLAIVIAAAALLLAVRRRWRLAAYMIVAGAGEMILDPVLKDLIGRLRPVVPHAIEHAPGHSFPSGHSFGSMVCYGALYLVFAPAVSGRGRRASGVAVAVLVALVGISRILLGVHYISDVIGGWALGIIWLAVTAAAFGLNRRRAAPPAAAELSPPGDA